MIYLATSVLVPDVDRKDKIDLRSHYFAHRPWFFGICALGLATLAIHNTALLDRPVFSPQNGIRGASVLLLSSVAWSEKEVWHKAAGVIVLIMLLVFVALFTEPVS